MTFVFKYLCSWFQYLVVGVKVEQFPYDLFVKHKSKECYETLELNSIKDLKLILHERIKVKYHEWFAKPNIFAVDVRSWSLQNLPDFVNISI